MVGFVIENGSSFAGKHLLVDLYNCELIPDHRQIELVMVDACIATGATVMFHHSHPFDGGGSSGVVILAESHGTWHSWTEEQFVAIDIFVCGECNPELAVDILTRTFRPKTVSLKLEKRGIVPDNKRKFKLNLSANMVNSINDAIA